MFNKSLTSFRMAALGLAVAGSMMTTTQVMAEDAVEVAASAAVSSMYLWRGQDLGNGSPAISGDVTVSTAGAYAGVWASSGDTAFGSEYDLYVGYGAEVEGFSFDVSLWNYNYANEPGTDGSDEELDTFGALTDLVISLGFGPVTFTYYDNVAGNTGSEYYTLEAGYEKFSAKLGYSDTEAEDSDYTHLDLTYAYNDKFELYCKQDC
ncbi:MAG: histidine kinase [Hahellaceae bacterium]|nr:histidine kinase [Hahellaceae bacterium]